MNKENLLNYGDLDFLIFVIIIVTTASLFIYFLSRRSIKFLNQTESKIRFIYRPKFSQSVGVIIAGIGLVFLWATLSLSPITKLDCNRSLENNTLQCKLVEIGIFDNQVSKKEFFEIKSVKVQAIEDEYSSRETTRRYNLLLLTNLGKIPFKRLSSYTKNYKLDSLYEIASSINKFLEKPVLTTLSVIQDDSKSVSAGIYVTVFFGIIALLIIGGGTIRDCSFDKKDNLMILISYRWFSAFGKDIIQYSLNDVQDMSIEWVEADESGSLYRISFVLNSGKIIPLTNLYSSGYEEKRQLKDYIKKFIKSDN